MILFKKVVSLKITFKNKSHWLHTFPINTIWKLLVETGQEYMEISLNHMDFTFFIEKEMLTSLFLFTSTNFHPLCYVKRALFRLKMCEFSRWFIVCRGKDWFRENNALGLINLWIQVHYRKFLRDHLIYIHFGSSQLPVSLKITAAFLIKKTLAIMPRNLLKQDLTYLSNVS